MADLKLATKNCIESVEKTHATVNEKNLLASDNLLVVCQKGELMTADRSLFLNIIRNLLACLNFCIVDVKLLGDKYE